MRIETRFRRGGIGQLPGELLVRIYPDALMADTHEKLLTQGELAAGQAYWHRVFDGAVEAEAWAALLGEATAERAAWIVERATPMNIADRPAEGSATTNEAPTAERSTTLLYAVLSAREPGTPRRETKASPIARALNDVRCPLFLRTMRNVIDSAWECQIQSIDSNRHREEEFYMTWNRYVVHP